METSSSQEVKEILIDILDHLSSVQRRQVLDFARFLRQQALDETAGDVPSPEPRIRLNLVPSVSLLDMTGLVALDGDAVADTEALYDGNGRA
jgi:hypothetical protein